MVCAVPVLSTGELARELCLSTRHVAGLIDRGLIRGHRLCTGHRLRRIRLADALAYCGRYGIPSPRLDDLAEIHRMRPPSLFVFASAVEAAPFALAGFAVEMQAEFIAANQHQADRWFAAVLVDTAGQGPEAEAFLRWLSTNRPRSVLGALTYAGDRSRQWRGLEQVRRWECPCNLAAVARQLREAVEGPASPPGSRARAEVKRGKRKG